MRQDELMTQIAELEREIAMLPEGSVTKKRIKGKEYYYHRITRNGKRNEKYLSFEDVSQTDCHIVSLATGNVVQNKPLTLEELAVSVVLIIVQIMINVWR